MTEDISIAVAGDFWASEPVARAASELSQPADVLGPAVAIFRQSDLAIANLETPLTRSETKHLKYGECLRGNPKAISVLQQGGIGLLTLANNHALDWGEQGLVDTLKVCDEANIATVGAGLTREEAGKPYRVTIKGRKVAVIGICESEFNVATESHGGACALDPVANYYTIQRLKEEADVVIALVHGGQEFSHYPSPGMVRTCRFLADVGASAVVCHHPHWVQGFEIYNGAPILYSLGNLFYTRVVEPYRLEVPIAQLSFSPDTLECSVHFDFFRISPEQVRLVELSEDELRETRARFETYSQTLQSPDDVLAQWNAICARNESTYLSRLLLIPYLVLRILRRLKIDYLIGVYARLRREALLRLENMIRCEAHREAILDILERKRAE